MIAEVYLVIIIVFVTLLLARGVHAEDDMSSHDVGSHCENSSLDRAAADRRARLIYLALVVWTFIALFPLYWTLSTSFKLGRDVTQGHLIPWVDFEPSWKGCSRWGFRPIRSSRPRTCATSS